jgi:hypothetical protein
VSTSEYFQRQERAFFAQAGKEIVRVHAESDHSPRDADTDNGGGGGAGGKLRNIEGGIPRPWPSSNGQPYTASHSTMHHPHPPQHHRDPSSLPYPSARRLSRGGPIPVTPTSVYPVPPHGLPPPPGPAADLPPPLPRPYYGISGPGLHSPPQEQSHSNTENQPDESVDDPDESWRRPIPYAERRRSGKHTKRVIVK